MGGDSWWLKRGKEHILLDEILVEQLREESLEKVRAHYGLGFERTVGKVASGYGGYI